MGTWRELASLPVCVRASGEACQMARLVEVEGALGRRAVAAALQRRVALLILWRHSVVVVMAAAVVVVALAELEAAAKAATANVSREKG